jgi:hypothetical protein
MRAMSGPNPVDPEPGADADIDGIQADIEETRKELGETVEALTAKLDLKERAEQKAAETKETVIDKAQNLRRAAAEGYPRAKQTLPVVLLLVGLTVGILLWRRRRSR